MIHKFVNAVFVGVMFLGISCDDDETLRELETTVVNENNEVPIPTQENETCAIICNSDIQLFSQIEKAAAIFETDAIWSGYKLSKMPMYLIHKDKVGNVDRGFIINPHTTIANSTEIDEDISKSVSVFRYDQEMVRAFETITSEEGNGLYDFKFDIDGGDYYIQLYNDAEVLAGEKIATYSGGFFDPRTIVFGSIDFIIHENFHTYQEQFGKSTDFGKKSVANEKLPIQKELLELRVLMHQLFKNFPNEDTSKSFLKERLQQYVAIRSKEIELDSGVQFKDVLTETDEGTARFIERMALRAIFPERANEAFIPGSVLDDNYGIVNSEILDQVMNFALLYELGASACFAIQAVDKQALNGIIEGKSIYDVAKSLLNMTPKEMDLQLQNAKDSVDWKAIQDKVKSWETLK